MVMTGGLFISVLPTLYLVPSMVLGLNDDDAQPFWQDDEFWVPRQWRVTLWSFYIAIKNWPI